MIVGAANSLEDVAGFTLLQRIVPDEILSRLLGITWGVVMGAVALGSITAPAIVHAIGARSAFAAVGAILPVLILITWSQLRAIDREFAAPAVELALLGDVPMFEPLSMVAKEHVAGSLIPVEVRTGEVVIRTGEPGDRFYIVAEGELEIANGVRATARPGDFFGEIALLRDVPRTATVAARIPSKLYALGRSDFIAAVTGHPEVQAAGETVVSERLGAEA